MSIISERFAEAMNKKNIKQSDIANKYNISRQLVNNLFTSQKSITDNFSKVCIGENINLNWLLTGEGKMFLNETDTKNTSEGKESILEDDENEQNMNIDRLKKELQEDIFSINLPKNVSNYAIQIWESDESFKSKFTTIEDFLSFVLKIAIKNLTIGDKKENQTPTSINRTFEKDTFEKKFEIKEEIKLDNQTYLKVYDIEEIEENKKSKVKTRIAKAYFFTIKDGENIYQETSAIPFSKVQKELDSK